LTLPVLPVRGSEELYGALAQLVLALGSVPPRFLGGGRRARTHEDVPRFASEGFGMIIGMSEREDANVHDETSFINEVVAGIARTDVERGRAFLEDMDRPDKTPDQRDASTALDQVFQHGYTAESVGERYLAALGRVLRESA
jgi:hypothetical protein